MSELIDSQCRIPSAIFATACFLVCSFLLGRTLFSGFRTRRATTSIVVSTLTGADILCLLGLLLGNKLDSKLPILTLMLLPLAILSDDSLKESFLALLRPAGFRRVLSSHGILDWGLLPPLLVCLFALGRAFCPPASWDELTYQLAVPMRWLGGRGDEIFPDNPYSGFPSLSGIAFRILLSNGGLLAPRLLVLAFFLLTAVSLDRILSPLCGPIAKVAIMTAFCASFPVLMISSSAYSEIFIVANFAGVVLLMQEKEWISRKNGQIAPGMLCGILAGSAASVKLTGFALVPAVIVLMLSRRPPLWRNIVTPFFFLATVFVLAALFYSRPFVLAGNPFHPFFAGIFGADASVLETSRYHHAIATGKYGMGGLQGFLFSPFLLAAGIGPFDGSIGVQFFILLLAAGCGAWLLLRDGLGDSFKLQIFASSLILYAFWFTSSSQARFIVPAILALSAASAHFLGIIHSRKIVFVALVVLSIISVPGKFAKDCLLSWRTAIGAMRKMDYLYSATGPGYVKACDVMKADGTRDKKVMMLFEHRGLYMPCEYIVCTPFFQAAHFTPPERTGKADVLDVMRREKITHVLVGLSLQDPDRLPGYLDRSAKIAEIIGSLSDDGTLRKIWEEEGFAIFKTTPLM